MINLPFIKFYANRNEYVAFVEVVVQNKLKLYMGTEFYHLNRSRL